ncbi:hypothetical protein DX980_15770 [Burkholderia gladioli]|uniref:Uncharacterized protein n=1 Tax=Burkholderia gladioli TaxID=28095 RepID=A0A2A7S6N2_BURGA|nr:hypothetical protein CEJ98_04220 [Burkholderia gladioli pv. gladioli]AYQ87521.1 hypothetical protein EDD84_09095 [Burkholderia gladioli]NBI47601.1 hypothetical protein [Burkholderia sp. ISTR5]NIE82717.1 hypothetical protein [Burkholderia sp. Tr-860]NIF65037.1 hypothetical protein [Burkholderia sp. Cy-647]NIF69391.1 hypothetical protein [Burkholderia sp. Ap-962]NIF86901.1 hypothetical protein [Burkholderia sp. Cy-637]NIF93825.1 hypothetical protein [Burkholderia sp. Ax-1720]
MRGSHRASACPPGAEAIRRGPRTVHIPFLRCRRPVRASGVLIPRPRVLLASSRASRTSHVHGRSE